MYTGPNIVTKSFSIRHMDPASGRGNRCSDLVNIYSNTDAARSINLMVIMQLILIIVSNEGVATAGIYR